MSKINLLNSFLAGLFAAGGSVFGKLTGDFLSNVKFIENIEILSKNIWIIQLLCLGLMVICNILNWRYFVKALHSTQLTLVATVLSSASNYCFSFIIGYMLFDEVITPISLCGIVLILFGLVYLCADELNVKME